MDRSSEANIPDRFSVVCLNNTQPSLPSPPHHLTTPPAGLHALLFSNPATRGSLLPPMNQTRECLLGRKVSPSGRRTPQMSPALGPSLVLLPDGDGRSITEGPSHSRRSTHTTPLSARSRSSQNITPRRGRKCEKPSTCLRSEQPARSRAGGEPGSLSNSRAFCSEGGALEIEPPCHGSAEVKLAFGGLQRAWHLGRNHLLWSRPNHNGTGPTAPPPRRRHGLVPSCG